MVEIQTIQLENDQKIGRDIPPSIYRWQKTHVKRCRSSLALRDMKIKNSKRYWHTAISLCKIMWNSGKEAENLDHSYFAGGKVK